MEILTHFGMLVFGVFLGITIVVKTFFDEDDDFDNGNYYN